MANRDDIVLFLNELLDVAEFEDYCINGMQVEGTGIVNKVVFGVSVSQSLFQRAVKKKADMIIVHHGIFWNSDPRPFALTGTQKKRLELLVKNNINLLAYHLPLDAHPEIGNNIQILKRLEIEPIKQINFGFLGKLNRKINREKFIDKINKKLQTTAQVFPYGNANVQQILVVSGGSSKYYQLANDNNADTFIGGDIKESVVRELEEVGINYINAGHYNSEKFGVQALSSVLYKKFNLNCEYVDIPNSV